MTAVFKMKGCGFSRELEESVKLEMLLTGNRSIDVMRKQENLVELNSEFQCSCVTTFGIVLGFKTIDHPSVAQLKSKKAGLLYELSLEISSGLNCL